MTRYTNGYGKSIVVCDQCRKDIHLGANVYSLSPGKAEEGYITRDYEKTETVLCLECADTISRVLAIMGTRYADSLALREAA
jgi:hypothetical protein